MKIIRARTFRGGLLQLLAAFPADEPEIDTSRDTDVARLYQAGKSYRAVARELGVTVDFVRKALQRVGVAGRLWGWKIPNGGRPRKPREIPVPLA